MDFLFDPAVLAALASLIVIEVVLGVDNIIFIIVLSAKLPPEQQSKARRLGIAMALLSRLLLLASIAWIMGLTQTAFTLFEHSVSWRDLMLFLGGLFLMYKATSEIHERLEGEEEQNKKTGMKANLWVIILQIMLLDIVFSLDSVITAVGMVASPSSQSGLLPWQQLTIMSIAVLFATTVMLVAANPIARFIQHHPTIKMLAFAFLLLIGVTLVAESIHIHVPKALIYAAMAFSIFVETLNFLARKGHRRPFQKTLD